MFFFNKQIKAEQYTLVDGFKIKARLSTNANGYPFLSFYTNGNTAASFGFSTEGEPGFIIKSLDNKSQIELFIYNNTHPVLKITSPGGNYFYSPSLAIETLSDDQLDLITFNHDKTP